MCNNYYDKEGSYNIFAGVKSEGLDKIEKAIALMHNEEMEYEKHKQLLMLTKGNLLDTIRKNVNYLWVDYFIEDAIKWISMRDTVDKRKRYDEKSSYDSLCYKIQDALDIQHVNITQIVRGGFDTYYYGIHFTSDLDEHKCVFMLEVPVISKLRLTEETKRYLGMLSFGFEMSKSSYRVCRHSYDATDFKAAIREIIESEDYKKHYRKDVNT